MSRRGLERCFGAGQSELSIIRRFQCILVILKWIC